MKKQRLSIETETELAELARLVRLPEYERLVMRPFMMSNLEANDCNVTHTAEAIDISRRTMQRYLKQYGITIERPINE